MILNFVKKSGVKMLRNRKQVISTSCLLIASVFISYCAGYANERPEEINIPLSVAAITLKQNARSASSGFNPLGVWHSASRMLGKGIHQFRESLQEGVKVAHMLKDDMDEGVTHIISKNAKGGPPLGSIPNPEKDDPNVVDDQKDLREGVLGGLLRFMGVNSNNMGVIALNVLIILGEWITSALIGKDGNGFSQSRMVKTNLLEWVTKGHNEKIDKMLKDAQDKALPENIIDTLKVRTGNSTSCVQLLICKMSPFIWGVQKTLDKQLRPDKTSSKPESKNDNGASGTKNNESSRAIPSVMDTLYNFIPTKHDFVHFGDDCEKRFPSCQLLKFNNKVPLV